MAVLDFPTNPTEDQLYQTAEGKRWIYKNGGWVSYGTVNGMEPVDLTLPRYDLAVAPIGAGGDLTKEQVFTVNNTTSGVKNITFTGMPSGRAMTVVVVVTGNTGTIAIPGLTFATGVDNTVGANKTTFVLFWDGAAFTVTSNIKQ